MPTPHTPHTPQIYFPIAHHMRVDQGRPLQRPSLTGGGAINGGRYSLPSALFTFHYSLFTNHMLRIALLFSIFLLSSVLRAQSTHTEINGVVNTLKKRINLQGYAQVGYYYEKEEDGERSNSFEVKRVILMARGEITDRWGCYIMYSMAGTAKILELYTDYRVAPWLTFRLGQFKAPFTIECPVSTCYVELIDCWSLATNYLAGVNGSDPLHGSETARDIGLMASGSFFDGKLSYDLALMNGQGINQKDKNNQKDVVGKLTVVPVEGLTLSASFVVGKGHAAGVSDVNPDIAAGDDYRRNRVSAGAWYKCKYFDLRSEYLQGRDGQVDSRGCYATASVHASRRLDIVASVDHLNKNIDGDAKQTNLVGGLQYWFYPKCRVQCQYTYCAQGEDSNRLQAQVQVRF